MRSFPRMMALGRFFFIFGPIPGSSEVPTGSMWVRDERRSRRGRKRLWECLGRRRRGAGLLEALEASTGDRGAVRGSDEAARALRAVYGKERRCDGCGGGGRGPGTPVDAAADLDGIWMPGGLR